MTKITLLAPAAALLLLAACGKTPDATNVADASNSAGAVLENSLDDLEADALQANADNAVDMEIANIQAEGNAANASNSAN